MWTSHSPKENLTMDRKTQLKRFYPLGFSISWKKSLFFAPRGVAPAAPSATTNQL
jgi:hypothetical protein